MSLMILILFIDLWNFGSFRLIFRVVSLLLKIKDEKLSLLLFNDLLKNSLCAFDFTICVCNWLIYGFSVINILNFQYFLKTFRSFKKLFFPEKVFMNIDLIFCVRLSFDIWMGFLFFFMKLQRLNIYSYGLIKWRWFEFFRSIKILLLKIWRFVLLQRFWWLY